MSKFRLFGGGSAQKTLERCRGWAGAVNLAEDGVRALSDAGLRETITRLKQRHRDGAALDDLVIAHSDVIQRSLFSAIVDEADLVMVDEAGLLPEISRDSESTSDHARLATLAARLEPGVHYDVDKARRIVSPTERGMALIEDWLGAEVY